MKRLSHFWINRKVTFRKVMKMVFKPKRILVIDLDALRDDPGFRIAWTANIAMSIKDEFCSYKVKSGNLDKFHYFDDMDMHAVANEGAERFINLLTHEHIPSV